MLVLVIPGALAGSAGGSHLKFLDLDSHSEFATVEEKLEARMDALKASAAGAPAGGSAQEGSAGKEEAERKQGEAAAASTAEAVKQATPEGVAKGGATSDSTVTDQDEMKSRAMADALVLALALVFFKSAQCMQS